MAPRGGYRGIVADTRRQVKFNRSLAKRVILKAEEKAQAYNAKADLLEEKLEQLEAEEKLTADS